MRHEEPLIALEACSFPRDRPPACTGAIVPAPRFEANGPALPLENESNISISRLFACLAGNRVDCAVGGDIVLSGPLRATAPTPIQLPESSSSAGKMTKVSFGHIVAAYYVIEQRHSCFS